MVEGSGPESPAVRHGAKLYFAAIGIGQVVALLRFVVLARLLGPEQLGLATTLVVTAAFFDMVSDTASDRFLIQDRHGDEPSVQNMVHFVYLVRGVLIAGALALFSVPLASLYHAPQLAFGFAFLGLTRLIIGFTHLDYRRVQRDHDFRLEGVNLMASEVISLAVTAVAAWWTRDFTAILYGLTARSLTTLALSHITATRKYRLAWSREHGPRLTKFSTPLVMTGLLVFISTQGDRVFIGNQLGAKSLGEYSATLLLIYSPVAVIVRYMHGLYLPIIAAQRADIVQRDQVSDVLGGQTLLLAIAMAVGFAVVAPHVVTLLYGHRYAQSSVLIGLVGLLMTTRFLINWPHTIAMSLGRSRTIFVSNFAKVAVFPCAYAALRLFGGLAPIVAGFVIGEMFSIGVALMFLNKDSVRPWYTGFDRLAAFVMTAILIVGWDSALTRQAGAAAPVGITALSIILTLWLIRKERKVLGDIVGWTRRTLRRIARRPGPAGPGSPNGF